MKSILKPLTLAGALCWALFCASPLMGQTVGLWDFNSGNLAQTAGATLGDLQYAGGTTSGQTVFGSTTTLGITNINGTTAFVMGFPAATNGMGYLMPTPGPNGGGGLVNQYTILLDMYYASASSAKRRPLIQTDDGSFTFSPQFFVVDPGTGIGPWGFGSNSVSGPYVGNILPNTWYRIAIAVNTNVVRVYTNGILAGLFAGKGRDAGFSLSASATALILANVGTNQAAPGYVNSIEIRDQFLSAGQIKALGTVSASGIPLTIPPVPSFIDSRTPDVDATGVGPLPAIHVVLDQGDTIVTPGSLTLSIDGAQVPATVVGPSANVFTIDYTVTNILEPSSVHSLSLVYQDNTLGFQTNVWSFTVANYQNVTLPAPFYFENFDELSEVVSNAPGPLPPGWSVANQTWPEHAGYSLNDLSSDSYKDWVLISAAREASWAGAPVNEPADRTDFPPIVLNGQLLSLSNFLSGNLMWEETDQRCGGCWGQYQELYTADINCTGKTNVYVAFNSFYEQNQDNMNAVEYSINQGASWLPVRYMFCTLGNGEQSDIYYTNDAGGHAVIDVGVTFSTVDANRNWAPWGPGCDYPAACATHATNYGIYIKAPISAALIPYIKGYTNDDTLSSKEIMIVRLPQADGQSKVRFRFLGDGTSSWFWGIDNFGLYTISTPVINVQPQSQTIDAGTPVTFTVAASSSTPLTYQWKRNGLNISSATNSSYTIPNVLPGDAAQYQVVVSNSDGPTKSSLATLTVVTVPLVLTQPSSQVADPGDTVTFAPSTRGGRPLTFRWYFNGVLVPNSASNLVVNNAQPSNSGSYQLIVTNSYGAATTSVAQLTVYLGPIASNLVVHLTFDGNLNDTSGRGNNATYAFNGANGDPSPVFVSGKIGQAFQYTTLNDASKFDYATFGYPDDLKLGASTAFSVSMWVNYTNQDDDLPFISNKDWNSSGNPGWGIFTQSGDNFRINVTGPTSADKFSVSPVSVLKNGAWHNLVVSLVRAPLSQSGFVYSYVDGVLVDRSVMLTQGTIDTADLAFTYASHLPGTNTPTPTVQTTWAVNIGQDGTGVYYDNGSAHDIGAKIDDLGIWRRALTANEAKGIYNAGLAGRDFTQAVAVERLTITRSGNNVIITWAGNATLKLQKSASLSPAVWTDVPGTLGASSATVPISGSAAFFKLSQ